MEFLGQGIATAGVWIAAALIIWKDWGTEAAVAIAKIEHKGLDQEDPPNSKKEGKTSGSIIYLVILAVALIATAIIW